MPSVIKVNQPNAPVKNSNSISNSTKMNGCNGNKHTTDGFSEGRSSRIVISGISGRFPECSHVDEFKSKLFDGVDMVTEDERRWPSKLHGLPTRTGKLKNITEFDAAFFGVHPKQAHAMDPQLRMLLELTFEAMLDAGVNPAEQRGSRTGVFIAVCDSESSEYWCRDPDEVTGYGLLGCCRAMFANRISYSFDFNGPSYSMDTACSSSMIALWNAHNAIVQGECDAAIVGGVTLLLKPENSLQFHRLGMLSEDGKCKAFDANGSGYVRSEAAVVIYLQKSTVAKRIYSTILGVKSNTDGYKQEGVTYPSGEMQLQLMKDTFAANNLNPLDVTYVEAHGTGTKVGDPQETNSVVAFFCSEGRTSENPLLIGSVKSNVGHAEGASGLISIAKVIISMEAGVIPANLHYCSPNPDIPALSDGRLKVISRNEEWNGSMAAINSFGFGGANVHVVLEANRRNKLKSIYDGKIPKIIAFAGRTQNAVEQFLSKAQPYHDDHEFVQFVNQLNGTKINGYNYRGFCLTGASSQQEVCKVESESRPIWYVFTGMGSQWPSMAKHMMNLKLFRDSICKSAEYLKPYGIDLVDVLVNSTETTFTNIVNSFMSITAVQVALVDILRHVGVEPDGMVGHSVGEIGCAYADNTLSAQQAVMTAYLRGKAILDSNVEVGAMAAVGLSWEEAQKRCPSGVYPACHNSEDSVSVSGTPELIASFVDQLKSEKIFAKTVDSSGIAFHSRYIAAAGPKLKAALDEIITDPKKRSTKWVSSSLPETEWNLSRAQYSSAEYHVNNLLSPVLFQNGLRYVPERAVVIEIAPTGLLQAILRRSLSAKNVVNVSVMKRQHEDNAHFFLSSLGKLYNSGIQIDFTALYPQIEFPVGKGTPMISPMIQWDHSIEWSVADFSSSSHLSGKLCHKVDLSKDEDKYLSGHKIAGRVLLPATGYLCAVWKNFLKINNFDFDTTPIQFENVSFQRATVLPEDKLVRLNITIFESTGKFEISESNSLVVSGEIKVADDDKKYNFYTIENTKCRNDDLKTSSLILNTEDIYTDLRLRGYQYDGVFKGIEEFNRDTFTGKLKWENNWISFLDTMLQIAILSEDTRSLYLPTGIQSLYLDPLKHKKIVDSIVEGHEIPVQHFAHLNIIQSGGVELRGLKSSSVALKQESQSLPILEKYVFVPFNQNTTFSTDFETARRSSLAVLVQIVLENMSTTRLKSIEMIENSLEDNLSEQIRNVLAKQPMCSLDGTIISQSLSNDAASHLVDIKVICKSIDEVVSLVNVSVNLLIVKSFNANKQLLATLSVHLSTKTFILIEDNLNEWNKLNLDEISLDIISSHICCSKVYTLFRKSVEIPRNPITIEVNTYDFKWINALKMAVKNNENTENRIYLYSGNRSVSGIIGFVNCLMQEPGGSNVRCFLINESSKKEFSLTAYSEIVKKDLVHNVFKNGDWGTYRHIELENSVKNPRKLPVEHAYVNTLTRGDLTTLNWIESPLKFHNNSDSCQELCYVYYSPLNFRDIMLSTGKLSPDSLPNGLGKQDCILGLEFAGCNTNGDRVMGMVATKGMATSVVVDKEFLLKVPDNWTLEQAATVPIVYSTSYYAMLIRGRMKRGESILIHAGSGGVGQAAISIALHMECKVFTTVSSEAKRNFLKETFPQLDETCIGNSRDSSFEQMVLTQTSGKGVDLVLNSLAGELLQASVRCLAIGGRFLEIGKVDLFNNSSLGMSVFLKNATFHGILVDQLFSASQEEKSKLTKAIDEGIKYGAVRPLPCTVFAHNELEQAFRYMASGKHLGKVILKVREEESISPTCKTLNIGTTRIAAISRTYMDPQKSYVIVGGLGGFGLELVRWLHLRGATKMVVTSRTGVRTGYQAISIKRLNESGVHVVVSTADATQEDGVSHLLREALKMGPIGGIFNLAAVLHDAMFDSLNADHFSLVCKPKALATQLLDTVSRTIAPHLDYFVCFSSISCGRGNIGQSNYGFANSVMERICEQRQVEGLPATAIQWGAIGDVGLVFNNMGGNDVEIGGTIPQRITSCLSTLDILLQQPHAVVASMVLAERIQRDKSASVVSLVDSVANILGIKDMTNISAETTLADMGMDSIMGAEIKQTLERNHDVVLTAQEIRTLTFARLTALDLDENRSQVNNVLNPETVSTSKAKISVAELVPKQCIVQMHREECQNIERCVFILHPIEGHVQQLQLLARQIRLSRVFGLQCTKNADLQSIETLAAYYIKQIQTVQPVGPYTFIGYSFGAGVAFEMGLQLEKVSQSVQLVLIDGSPSYLLEHTNNVRSLRSISENEEEEQSGLLVYFVTLVSNVDVDEQQLFERLLKEESWKDRLRITVDLLSPGMTFSPEDIAEAADSLYSKLKSCNKYKPSIRFEGSVTLFKATTSFLTIDNDYGLSKICKSHVKLHSIEGDHRTILEGKSVDIMAKILNDCLSNN